MFQQGPKLLSPHKQARRGKGPNQGPILSINTSEGKSEIDFMSRRQTSFKGDDIRVVFDAS